MSEARKITPEETFHMIQCGILDLNFPMAYGILLLGNTKAGKTTTAHHLMHQDLQGDINNDNIVYKLRGGLDEYMGAKIGDQEMVSETQVPNLFTFDKVKEMIGGSEQTRQKYLIDCPGYLDTFGYFRVLTNRYFHFQIFSKVENIKFIITINFQDITRTAVGLKQTFSEFLGGFQDLYEIKQKILKATCVMVTAVPDDQDLEKVRKRLKVTTLVGEFDQFYIQLRDHLVGVDTSSSKIFIMRAAKLGERNDRNNTILEEIERKTEYWKRQKDQEGNVDLKNVCISILEYGSKDERNFKEEMESLDLFYREKICQDISSFAQVFRKLQDDVGGEDDRRDYIEEIIKSNSRMQQQRKQESEACKFLYDKYESKRRELKVKLFKPISLFQTSSFETSSEMPVWLCKIKAFFMIERNFDQVGINEQKQRSINALNRKGKVVQNTLNIYVSLYKIMKDKKETKNLNYQDIINYAYNVFKAIKIFNKLYQIIHFEKPKKKNHEDMIKGIGTNFILTDYPSLISKLFFKQRRCSIEIFSQTLLNLNIKSDLTLKASTEVIKFLVEYQNLINDRNLVRKYEFRQWNPKKVKSLNKILIEKIAKIKTNQFLIKKKEGSLSLDCIREILEAVQQNNKKIYESAENAVDNQILKIQNIQNVQILADCLYKNDKLDLAVQLYDCLGDAHKIFEVLNEKENRKRKKENYSIDDLIQYMEMANKYHRTSLAIEKGQEAFHIAQDSANLEKTVLIALSLKNICSKKLKPQVFDITQGLKGKVSLNINIPFQTYDKIERCIPPSKQS